MSITNPGESVRYLQIHSTPPDSFYEWSEEQKEAWMKGQYDKYPPVVIDPGFKGEIDLPSPDCSTGISFSKSLK